MTLGRRTIAKSPSPYPVPNPAFQHDFYLGPVCGVWYKKISPGTVLDEHCDHASCWYVMTIGDSNVGFWFRDEYDVLTLLRLELAKIAADIVRFDEIVSLLNGTRRSWSEKSLFEHRFVLGQTVSSYNAMRQTAEIARNRLRALIRVLEAQEGSPDTQN